ncbi:e3 ubiquitin-protein ligase ubr4 [Anaeramoeba ignava]|uniref:E3 ubiquitin-protein ligase ubr4 n=1 Tax=Anaeramoeba ignava TaxID=1746090 RepID=A0A9Q0RCR2_ANAIG|nr:e3 ubiquitin-protein ligase ubr4 [Anaeramoeba ignava]
MQNKKNNNNNNNNNKIDQDIFSLLFSNNHSISSHSHSALINELIFETKNPNPQKSINKTSIWKSTIETLIKSLKDKDSQSQSYFKTLEYLRILYYIIRTSHTVFIEEEQQENTNENIPQNENNFKNTDLLLNVTQSLPDLLNFFNSDSFFTEHSVNKKSMQNQLLIIRFFLKLIRLNDLNRFFVSSSFGSILVGSIHEILNLLVSNENQNFNQKIQQEEQQKQGSLLKIKPRIEHVDLFPFFDKNFLSKYGIKQVLEEPYFPFLETCFQIIFHFEKMKSTCIKDCDNLKELLSLEKWSNILCILIDNNQIKKIHPLLKNILLKLADNDKQKHYLIRDTFLISREFENIQLNSSNIQKSKNLVPYEYYEKIAINLINLRNIVSIRPQNWIKFCIENSQTIPTIFRLAFLLPIEKHKIICLQLLTFAFSHFKKENDMNLLKTDFFFANQNQNLQHLISVLLIQEDNKEIRAQSKQFLFALYSVLEPKSKLKTQIFKLVWENLLLASKNGKKGNQFMLLLIDLINEFEKENKDNSNPQIQSDREYFVEKIKNALKSQNVNLIKHPNSHIYQFLQKNINFGGFYFEEEPCFICNNPDSQIESCDIEDLVEEIKYTDSAIYIKFSKAFSIEKLRVDFVEISKKKQVRLINFYYCNKNVGNIGNLKNKWELWKKVRSLELERYQSQAVIELPIPIVASNFLVEFAEFYQKPYGFVEKLICPRCQVEVHDRFGVCSQCSDNAYQCRQCRNINYENLDGFLCNECGYCRYGKFHFKVDGKKTVAIEPVENDEDLDSSMKTIDKISEESLNLFRDNESKKKKIIDLITKLQFGFDRNKESFDEDDLVNSNIMKMATIYNTESRNIFQKMVENTKKILLIGKTITQYLNLSERKNYQQEEETLKMIKSKEIKTNKCYGCAENFITMLIKLIESISNYPSYSQIFFQKGILMELLQFNTRHGSVESNEITHGIFSKIIEHNREAHDEFLNHLMLRFESSLLKFQSFESQVSVCQDIKLLEKISNQKSVPELEVARIRFVQQALNQIVAQPELNNPFISEFVILPFVKIIQTSHFLQIDNKTYLLRKYLTRWFSKSKQNYKLLNPIHLFLNPQFLKRLIFNPWSHNIRLETAKILRKISTINPKLFDKVCGVLVSVMRKSLKAADCSKEYFSILKRIYLKKETKYKLVIKGFLSQITELIMKEIERISVLEQESAMNKISEGLVLATLIDILQEFLNDEYIIEKFKRDKHMQSVLQGFLLLRGLVLQKNKLTNLSSKKLSAIFEKLRTQDEKSLELFIESCMNGIAKHQNARASKFIIEQITGIIAPVKKKKIYKMELIKTPSQEEFIRGSMTHNPYTTEEVGPLMRDVKNRICTELELLGLIEDDNGMELLVDDKIIKLHLPVSQVFNKIWKTSIQKERIQNEIDIDNDNDNDIENDNENDNDIENSANPFEDNLMINSITRELHQFERLLENNENQDILSSFGIQKKPANEDSIPPMIVVYRLQGLDGEATEPIVDSLPNEDENEEKNNDLINLDDFENQDSKDKEKHKQFSILKALGKCGGIETLSDMIKNISESRIDKELLNKTCELLIHSARIKSNRHKMIELGLHAIILEAIKKVFKDPSLSDVLNNFLVLIEKIFGEINFIVRELGTEKSNTETPNEEYQKIFNIMKKTSDKDINEKIAMFLEMLQMPLISKDPKLAQIISRILPFLAYNRKGCHGASCR